MFLELPLANKSILQTETHTFIDLGDVQGTLDSMFHQNFLYDYLNSQGHFYKWCDSRGYGDVDPKGFRRGSSQIWFKEYSKAKDGEKACPPRLNFLGYLDENYIYDSSESAYLEFPEYLATDPNTPEWVRNISTIILKEFASLFGKDPIKIKIRG